VQKSSYSKVFWVSTSSVVFPTKVDIEKISIKAANCIYLFVQYHPLYFWRGHQTVFHFISHSISFTCIRELILIKPVNLNTLFYFGYRLRSIFGSGYSPIKSAGGSRCPFFLVVLGRVDFYLLPSSSEIPQENSNRLKYEKGQSALMYTYIREAVKSIRSINFLTLMLIILS
jgi:hypothetical protein